LTTGTRVEARERECVLFLIRDLVGYWNSFFFYSLHLSKVVVWVMFHVRQHGTLVLKLCLLNPSSHQADTCVCSLSDACLVFNRDIGPGTTNSTKDIEGFWLGAPYNLTLLSSLLHAYHPVMAWSHEVLPITRTRRRRRRRLFSYPSPLQITHSLIAPSISRPGLSGRISDYICSSRNAVLIGDELVYRASQLPHMTHDLGELSAGSPTRLKAN